jgi:hypothetical protein
MAKKINAAAARKNIKPAKRRRSYYMTPTQKAKLPRYTPESRKEVQRLISTPDLQTVVSQAAEDDIIRYVTSDAPGLSDAAMTIAKKQGQERMERVMAQIKRPYRES